MGLIFNVGRLAERIGVHRNTITNWIKKGVLPAAPAPAKRYTISKEAFILFCTRTKISSGVMETVLNDPALQYGGGPEADPLSKKGRTPPRSRDRKKQLPTRTSADIPGTASDSVMVVGGGIAGIQAALDLSDTGFHVFLVEKSASIGGTMARLDKTFPTDDCSPCILLPRLGELNRRANIELITLAEVESVAGRVGDFRVRVKKNPRYIDTDKCIACDACSQHCPVYVSDSFNAGMGSRKAVFLPYDQAVPRKYVVDPFACLWLTRKKCRACETFCPTGAVNFNQVAQVDEIRVGAVILTPGFKPYDPSVDDSYGYPGTTDLVTSMEFERLLSAGGPTRGTLLRPSDRTVPKKIAWVQCVGSRHKNQCKNAYCSNICCMSTVKQAMAVPEQTRTVFFDDLRSHGKGSEAYFNRAKEDSIQFIRALPWSLDGGAGGKGVAVRYIDESGMDAAATFDMVVLAIGFESPEGTARLARQFGVALDDQGFARIPYFDPSRTDREGVYAAGAFTAPTAISRAVVQASAAAALVSTALAGRRCALYPPADETALPPERDISGEIPSIGVYICACGKNISGVVDVAVLADYAATLPHVDYVENNEFSCAVDVQKRMASRIRKMKLNRIVVASCSPITHEHMFRRTLRRAGLNEFMLAMANIRNLNAWVHSADPLGATQKAMAQVGMAVARVALHIPLAQNSVKVTPRALVVGGGVAGMTAALTIAGAGVSTLLVEKEARLGGNALNLENCFNGEPVGPLLTDLVGQVKNHPYIRICPEAVIENAGGSVGRFTAEIRTGKIIEAVNFGAAVMATGAVEAVPHAYGYGSHSGVMTQMEFDCRVMARPDALSRIKDVVFLQCVGSREKGRVYCSRICCIHSVKAAICLKEHNPAIRVHILYREMRTYGKWETLYKTAKKLGVSFIRYSRKTKPKVHIEAQKLAVETCDLTGGGVIRVDADYLVLASGVMAGDNQALAKMFRVALSSDGFFNGAHPKLRPVDLSVKGLFLAGLCNYPKPINESIEEARAAGLRAVNLLSQKEIKSEAVKAYVTKNCDGCALCVDVCPFGAISLAGWEEGMETNIQVVVDPALCRGCGICAATCGRDGILVHGFTTAQLKKQVWAAPGPDHRGRQTVPTPPALPVQVFKPLIIGFLCNWCSYAGADGAGVARMQYPSGFRPIRVMCSGMVRPDLVLEAFNAGADGVMILGCHPGECHYIEGNTRAAARAGAISYTLERMGVDPDRFGFGWISAAEAGAFADQVNAFSQKIEGLGPLKSGQQEGNR